MQRRSLAQVVLALSIFAVMAVPTAASATPVEGPAGQAFYTPPSSTPAGSAGELVWYRPATVDLNVTLPSVKAWTVLYQSTDQQGRPDWVTGTVIVPSATWRGSGPRPVVAYAEGTQGLGQSCAPSLQMAAGTEYDGGAIIESLKKGYAVAVTDYQGYTTGAIPTFAAGRAEGQAVLDVVRAGRQIPGSEISSSAPVVLWGYSQGGQAASWAAELQSSYAPDVKMIGLAAGGTPANLQAIGEFDDASVGTAFGLDGLEGLSTAYLEEFKLALYANTAGLKAIFEKLLKECAIQSLREFRDVNTSEYTLGNKTFTELEAEHPVIQKVINEQQLGTQPVPVPVYQYHGLKDEFVPVAQDVELHNAWCSLGVSDDFQLYPGDHLLTDPTAIGNVMRWIEERLAGRRAPSTCGQHAPGATLPASARLTPETGDLIVPLPAWELSGKVTEASGISVEVPKGSTLTAEGDVTSGQLSASLSIPPINQTIWIGLIPVTVRGALTPTGPIQGSVGLSDSGVFSESATGSANELVSSVGLGFLTVPVGCTTVEPMKLPLNISEQVNALAVGGFSSKTQVTVPEFGGCGIFGPILSSTMSGPGSTIELTAKPPPPINW